MTTPKLLLPELIVGQAGKELTHNQALAILDQLTQPTVVDKDLAAPPGSPANGSMYIVAAAATGTWSGQSGKLAVWLTTVAAWTFIAPADGWAVWVADEATRYERRLGAWVFAGTVTADTGSIGYAAGSGGTVTQATGKSTNVTLNKPSGRVTMNNASLAAGASVVFQINNTIVAGQDTAILAPNGSGAYRAEIAYMATGGFGVRVTNVTAGALSDALNINFTIIKGALA